MIALLIAAASLAAAPSPDPAKGRFLAEKYCAGCHAVGPIGASRRAAAPPFRQLQARYPVEALQEALAEGISTGHPEMPEFVFFPGDIDNFIAYLKTFEPSKGTEARRP